MSNQLYEKARHKFARGELHWYQGGDTVRAGLVRDGYVPNITSHEFLSDINDVNLWIYRSTWPQLYLMEPHGGVLDAEDIAFLNADTYTFSHIVIFKDTGTLGDETAHLTSPLIALIDTALDYNGDNLLPFTATGSDVVIEWSNGPYKIAKI